MNNKHRTQNTIQSNKLNVEKICCFVVVVVVCLLWLLLCVLVVCFLLFFFGLFLFFVFAVGLIVCCGVGVGWVDGSTDHPCFSVVKSFNGML